MRHQNDIIEVDRSNQDPVPNHSGLIGTSCVNCVTDPIVKSIRLSYWVPIEPD